MRRIAHETKGFLKHAVRDEDFWDFKPGEPVIADGLPGKVTSVSSGPTPGYESYDVVLDNGMGGGQYTASQLYRADSVTASLTGAAALTEALEPVEAGSQALADHWYPELGTILVDRPPIEQVRRIASLQRTAAVDTDPFALVHESDQPVTPPEPAHPGDHDHFKKMWDYDKDAPAHKPWSAAKTAKKWERGEVAGKALCPGCDELHEAAYDHEGEFGQGPIFATFCPKDNLADYHTLDGLHHTSTAAGVLPDDVSQQPEDGTERGEDLNVPDACSWCGNPGPWTDQQDTGRGTRIRCATCGGTMRLNSDDEASTSGIQWAPEFNNSPENRASRQGDPRATIHNYRVVGQAFAAATLGAEFGAQAPGRINAAASREAGYTIFDSPELADALDAQIQATAAALGGLADEDFAFQFTATWADVQAKAKRIRDDGGVRILAAGPGGVVGEVQGESAIYESELNYVPFSHRVSAWHCGCKWGAYAWGRSPAYRRFEGRQCSHVLALQYEASSRGMFGREVTPDTDRMEGQYQRTPVQTEHIRDTERRPGGPKTRRSVPPGNMRRTFSSKTAYQYEDVSPSFEWARILTALGNPPSKVLDALKALGVPHHGARAAIDWATKSAASGEFEADGVVHQAMEIKGDLITTTSGETIEARRASLHLAKEQEATADPMGGTADPGTDIPGIDTRNQSDRKHKKKHLLHHTNDARSHAPEFGYGLPWGGTYAWCDQCNGSGCGHCGGSGQVATGDGQPGNPSDLSSTESPVADQSVDAGSMIGGDDSGMNATGAMTQRYPCACCQGTGEHSCGHECYACDSSGKTHESDGGELCAPNDHLDDDPSAGFEADIRPDRRDDLGRMATQHTADYSTNDFGSGNPAQTYQHITPHADSGNPGSTGWAASADPTNWVQPIVNSSFGSWESNWHDEGRDDDVCGGCGEHIHRSNDESVPWVHSVNGNAYCDVSHRPGHDTSDAVLLAGFPGRPEASPTFHESSKKTPGSPGDPPTVSGVALKAADTGRILMIQRSNKDEKDPARGTWEFPGGHHEEGDQTSLHAGIREWEEEVGQPFPEGGHVSHTWRSGPYQGHVVVIPEEAHVDFSKGRSTDNPDDPDGDDHEQAAWWDVDHAKKNPALRSELKSANPFDGIKKAAVTVATNMRGNGSGRTYKPTGRTTAGFVTLDEVRAIARAEELRTGKTSEQLLREHVAWQESHFATLNDEPEGALPSTDGQSTDGDNPGDDDVATALGYGGDEEASPGLDPGRAAPWGYPESAADHPNPAVAQPGGEPVGGPDDEEAQDDADSTVMRSEGSLVQVAEGVPEEVAMAAAFNPALADFTQTAGFKALAVDAGAGPDQGGGVAEGGPPNDSDIAKAAQALLQKTSMKDFSFAEQQELIAEGGGKARARNFNDLKIAGTHYANIEDDQGANDDLYLLL